MGNGYVVREMGEKEEKLMVNNFEFYRAGVGFLTCALLFEITRNKFVNKLSK